MPAWWRDAEEFLAILTGVLQVWAPLLVALVALIVTIRIQTGQARTAEARLKLDLFEKRYEFLQMLRNLAAISLFSEERYFDRIQKDYGRFNQYKLLFPATIGTAVERLVRMCDELLIANQERKKPGRPSTEQPDGDDTKVTALRAGIRKEMDALQERIERFIRIDWNG